ncbi:MAG: hypothetical protein K9I70_02980 [Chitinophagaceae bacterium]|nr:hypothetical protein [Chitinophagaceae bacterium]
MNKLSICLFLSLLVGFRAYAQKIFSEGVINYDVFVNGSEKPDGLYSVTVKNNMSRRELLMNNGFNNILISNQKTGSTITLNVDAENKYALTMTASQVAEQNKRFEKAVFSFTNQKKTIAGYASSAATVRYLNGEEANFYFTADLLPPHESFNILFPGLQGVPLEYEVKSNTDKSIRFVATAFETKIVDVKVFDIPKDYKIVSKEELEKIK